MENNWCHFVPTYDEHNKITWAPCSFKKYLEWHNLAGMLDVAVGMEMILLTPVRLVAGPSVQAWGLMSIDDKSFIRRKICLCTRFLLMLWLLFITFLKKYNGPQTKNRHFCIYPPRKNIEFKFWLLHLFALNRDFPHCAAVTIHVARWWSHFGWGGSSRRGKELTY